MLNGVARALDLGPEAREHLFRLADVPVSDREPLPDRVDDDLRQLLAEWRHLARMTFLDPAGRQFFAAWDRAAEASVAHLRLALGYRPDDPRTLALVEELAAADDDFRRLWGRHDVRGKTHETKQFRHSAVGDLTLAYRTFDVRGASGQQLIVYRAAPNSRDADAVRLLGMLTPAHRPDGEEARHRLPLPSNWSGGAPTTS